MQKKLDKKIFLLAAVVFLLTGSLIWLAFFLQLEKIKEISDNIQKEQLDSSVQQGRSQKILEIGKELGDVEKNKVEMETMIIDKDNSVPFLRMLEDIATATGNKIKINVTDLSKLKSQAAKKPVASESDAESAKDIQKENQTQKAAQTKSKKPDVSNQLGFTVELFGNFNSLVDFFTKLENLPYFVQVYNFKASPASKNQLAGNKTALSQNVDGQPPETEESANNIESTITIGLYTNGAK